MAYSKAKLKSSGDKTCPCFRPFWIGKLDYLAEVCRVTQGAYIEGF
jgi:hypothetical protein